MPAPSVWKRGCRGLTLSGPGTVRHAPGPACADGDTGTLAAAGGEGKAPRPESPHAQRWTCATTSKRRSPALIHGGGWRRAVTAASAAERTPSPWSLCPESSHTAVQRGATRAEAPRERDPALPSLQEAPETALRLRVNRRWPSSPEATRWGRPCLPWRGPGSPWLWGGGQVWGLAEPPPPLSALRDTQAAGEHLRSSCPVPGAVRGPWLSRPPGGGGGGRLVPLQPTGPPRPGLVSVTVCGGNSEASPNTLPQ